MYKQNAPDPSPDRFNAVESLADEIFDRITSLGDIDVTEDPIDDALAEFDGTAENVVPLFSKKAVPAEPILAKTEKLLGSFLNALEQTNNPQDITEDRSADFTHAPDIGYGAAYRRSQLPQGVQPLKPQAQAPSEEATVANIRAMMDEQEVEFEKVRIEEKREKAREILAPLESQDAFDPPATPQSRSRRSVLFRRAVRGLDQVFRNYYFLAITLSGWCTLTMMVVIDPAVGQALGKLSLLLLLAASCMFSHKTALVEAKARSRWRRSYVEAD